MGIDWAILIGWTSFTCLIAYVFGYKRGKRVGKSERPNKPWDWRTR